MDKKTIIDAINATINKKTKVPIAECVFLSNDRLIATDIEIFLSIPYESGINACIPAEKFIKAIKTMDEPVFNVSSKQDGDKTTYMVCIAAHPRKVSLPSSNSADFPVIYNDLPEVPQFLEVGTLTAEELTYLERSLSFIADDKTRPGLRGVFLSTDVAATNLQQLYWQKLSNMKSELNIPKKVVKIMLTFGGGWKLSCATKYLKQIGTNPPEIDKRWATFENEEGVRISFIPIEEKFLDYKWILERALSETHTASLEISPVILRKEIANAMEFISHSNNLGIFSLNGHLKLSTAIEEEDEDYTVEFEKKTFKATGTTQIALDLKLLDLIAAQLPSKEPMKFRFWGSNKQIIVNDCYLQLPLDPKR